MQPGSHKHNPPGPPLPFFSPFSSRLSGRALGPAAVVTKNRPASFGCEEVPLTWRVPEDWQVAVGVDGPSKPERSDSPSASLSSNPKLQLRRHSLLCFPGF